MASITAKTLFWIEEKCEGKRGLSLDVRLDFRFTLFAGLTGRSEAVLSKYLILWFNALFKGTEGAEISIENDGRCRQISHHYRTDDRTQTKLALEGYSAGMLRGCSKTQYPLTFM